jgi:hypothetical protein
MPAVSAARLLGIRGTGGVFTTGYHQPYVGKRDAQAVYPSLNGRRCATFIGCHFYWHGGPSVRKDWNDAGHPGICWSGRRRRASSSPAHGSRVA